MPIGQIIDIVNAEKHNSYAPVRIALNVPINIITRVEEARPFLPDVSTAPEPVRYYPFDSVLANTLGSLGRISADEYKDKHNEGYYSDDFVGKTGLEAQYENDGRSTRAWSKCGLRRTTGADPRKNSQSDYR
jgi:penicillin-binding protein 2